MRIRLLVPYVWVVCERACVCIPVFEEMAQPESMSANPPIMHDVRTFVLPFIPLSSGVFYLNLPICINFIVTTIYVKKLDRKFKMQKEHSRKCAYILKK